MNGLFALDNAFELLARGSPFGPRRRLDVSAVRLLTDLSERYASLQHSSVGLFDLGQELYAWLDGEGGHLSAFLQQADRPLRFEICAAHKYPSEPEWALLRAPWEWLADHLGFLAEDVPLGFSPVRRIGREVIRPSLGPFRIK